MHLSYWILPLADHVVEGEDLEWDITKIKRLLSLASPRWRSLASSLWEFASFDWEFAGFDWEFEGFDLSGDSL